MTSKLLYCITLLLLSASSAFAQTFPRVVALSDRVGDAIDTNEQVYFNLFPNDRPFFGATVQQFTDSTFTITINRGDVDEFIDLDTDRFYALRKYIDEFEIRYTGAFSRNWDYIIFYTDPLRNPFGPGSIYELTLVSGDQKSGHVLWADEQGIYLSQMISARSPELTASRLAYYPRESVLRVSPKNKLLKSLGQGPDVVFAGEPATYTNVTLPQLQKDALYPRGLPPEIIARAARNSLVPAVPPAEPVWNAYKFPHKSSSIQFLFYLPTLKYFAPPGLNQVESSISSVASTGTEKKPTVSSKAALFFTAMRFSMSPRTRLGLSVSQSAPNKTPVITNTQLQGVQAADLARDFRFRPGSLTVGGTYIGFDFIYLLRTAPDYVTFATSRSNRLTDFDIKLTAGPSLGLTSTVSHLVNVGRVRTGDGATFTSNTTYGLAEKTKHVLAGGHIALDVTAFLNRTLSIGAIFDSALYFNYNVPESQLIDFFGSAEKWVSGPENNMLWLSTFFFGLSFHF